jgi:hypothetical protein
MAEETCSGCGAVYEVIMRQAPVLVEDKFYCVVCGHLMKSWRSPRYPEFHIVRSGRKPANS